MQYVISSNPNFGSLEIKFSSKPADTVREALKALKFRWNGKRGIWYGYADEDAVKKAITGDATQDAAEQEQPAEATQSADKPQDKPQKQDHIKIYWNGIKIDGGKLIKCWYSMDNNRDHTESVSIYADSYGSSLPRDVLDVSNETDIYTDYFDKDSATVTPEHPLYKYFRYAAMKQKARSDRPRCEKIRAELDSGRREPWPGHYDSIRAELARREAFLKIFDAATDPGQPTAADLEKINLKRQEEENARRAAEQAEQQRREENFRIKRGNGHRLILDEIEKHPIRPGAPYVLIHWSEHPAFFAWGDDELKLSLTAAENILRTLDEEQHNTRESEYGSGWYDKTSFTVFFTNSDGEQSTYKGRYDLGDGDGGLIAHIRAWGEYTRTHNEYGHPKEATEETNDILQLAEYLTTQIEPEEAAS